MSQDKVINHVSTHTSHYCRGKTFHCEGLKPTQRWATAPVSTQEFESDFRFSPLWTMPTCLLFTGRYWEMVQKLKINQFYVAPTAIHLLLKYGDQWVHKYDRSCLKTLGSGTANPVSDTNSIYFMC